MQHLTKQQLIDLAMDEQTFQDERWAAVRELQKRQDDFPPDDELIFDAFKRLKYHPKIHWNKKLLTEQEKVYLCKFHDQDGIRALSFALGKTEVALSMQLVRMEKNGTYWQYRNREFKGIEKDEWRVTG